MSKSPLLDVLRRIARDVHAQAVEGGDPIALDRRTVLRSIGASAGLAAIGVAPAEARGINSSVAVVGAGLAGLAAAYDLRKAGIDATIFEGNTRLGGRCFSIRGVFADGQVAEHGGEFIDTGHGAIRRLARELGLHLDDVLAATPRHTQALYYFDGQPYSIADAARDYLPVYPTVQSQNTRLGNFDFRGANPFARALDRLSVVDWADLYVPGGAKSRFGRLVVDAIGEEYAADASELSAIIVPGLFAPDPRTAFNLYYTASDQRFHVRGGNDQIPTLLGRILASRINMGTVLTAITALPSGKIRLSLSRDSVVFDQVFDRVILALPFSVMRASVDFSRAGFRPLKQRAINELGMGRSVKFQLQFDRRLWRDLGCSGEIRLVSRVFQTSWEVTRAQPGRQGVMNFWSGGSQATLAGELDAVRLAQQCFRDAAPLLPGLREAFTGRMTRDVWARNPWSLGSYSVQPIGYATTLAGIEPVPEGHCFFAGEHTEADYGYLNAGVASGQRAARQVVASLSA